MTNGMPTKRGDQVQVGDVIEVGGMAIHITGIRPFQPVINCAETGWRAATDPRGLGITLIPDANYPTR